VDDFLQFAGLVHLPACPVVGWSSGGPYALACSVRAPDRVASVGLAAAVAPARQGTVGYVQDWIAESLPWGFALADVRHGVHVWWGKGDPLTSRSDTEYLTQAIGRATLVTYPSEGHMFPVTHWADMLSVL
jgi:pimeloyl-ACP methyl ester carboxylesterase